MHFVIGLALAGLLGACAAPTASARPYHLIPGAIHDDKGPDGNTIVLDAPEGLIVVDSGRHPDHAAKILAYAKAAGKPVAAIVNTHWHFDHTTGNRELIEAFPEAQVIASAAIDGALYKGFAKTSRADAEEYLKSGQASEPQKAEIERGLRAMDNLQYLRSAAPVTASGSRDIAGRPVDVRLAPFAVSEGDVWLVVPDERLVIAGDLVVDIVPFMDTACVDGWSKALKEVAAVDFQTLIPGHGAAMSKPQFLAWKSAFDRFEECARSKMANEACTERWVSDAAQFIPDNKKTYVREAATYYLKTRLRTTPAEQRKYCAVPAA